MTYLLRDYYNEVITGSFYEPELQKVKNDDVFLIDKILEKKGNKIKVSFLGYPNETHWIDKSAIVDKE